MCYQYSGIVQDPIPEQPTKEQAEAALDMLRFAGHLRPEAIERHYTIIKRFIDQLGIIGWNIGKLYMPLCRWLDSEPMPEEPIEDDGDDNEKR